MPTSAELASITNKKLLGFTDFEDRFLRYLQNDIRESVQRLFVQGSFVEKMPLSSPGADTVQVDLKPTELDGFAHDGLGRLLDLEQIDRTATFENTVAQDYEVGAAYIEYPVDIRPNPRLSIYEYDRLVEGIGVQAEPDSVSVGVSTLTFRVDSLFEQGVAVGDHTGRVVRVYKKTPGDNATTGAIAIETATVFFSGGQNQITTTGLLGQSTPSAVASDYFVQLVGIIVLKDTATNRPSQNPGSEFFVGVVTGNGGTPVAFDISGQVVIQAQAAVGIIFSPFTGAAPISWNIAATDVQAAIEELVADLTSTAGGANLIRIDPSAFNQSNPSASLSWGGLGTSGDELFTKMTDVDRQMTRSRFGITLTGDNTTGMIADLEGGDQIATFGTDTLLLKGADFLEVTGGLGSGHPVVRGQSIEKSVVATDASTPVSLVGHYEDLQIMGRNEVNVEANNVSLHNVMINGNVFTEDVAIGSSAYNQAHLFQQLYVAETGDVGDGTGGSIHQAVARFTRDSEFSSGLCLVQASSFYTGDITASGPALLVNGTGSNQTSAMATRVFLNCWAFNATGSGDEDVLEVDGHDIIFIGCQFTLTSFAGNDLGSVVRLGADAKNVRFYGCQFWTDGPNMVMGSPSVPNAVTFEKCRFGGNFTSQTGGQTRQLLNTTNVDYIDCEFEIENVHVRPVANTPDRAIIEVTSGKFVGNRLRHNETTMHGTTNYNFTDCEVSKNEFEIPPAEVTTGGLGAGNPGVYQFTDCRGEGNKFIGTFDTPSTVGTDWDWYVITMADSELHNTLMDIGIPNPGAAVGLESAVLMSGRSKLTDVRLGTFDAAGRPSIQSGARGYFNLQDSSEIDGVRLINGFYFSSQSPEHTLCVLNGIQNRVSRVRGNRSSELQAGFEFRLVEMYGTGSGHHVRNCEIILPSDGTFSSFVRNNGSGDFHTVTENDFFWEDGGVDPGALIWINLTLGGGGTHSIAQQNKLINGGATVPAVQIGATSLAAGAADNILAGGVVLPV